MNETTKTNVNAAKQCPRCDGRGSHSIWVEWSDGLGGTTAECPLCDGSGSIDFDPAEELARLKMLLKPFLYEVWLACGCHIRKATGPQGHVQGVLNSVLRTIRDDLPKDVVRDCKVKDKLDEPNPHHS